jgi:hypothetical protein
MTNDKIIGVVLGSIVCAVVVAGNLGRADPYFVTVYPDLVSCSRAWLAAWPLLGV